MVLPRTDVLATRVKVMLARCSNWTRSFSSSHFCCLDDGGTQEQPRALFDSILCLHTAQLVPHCLPLPCLFLLPYSLDRCHNRPKRLSCFMDHLPKAHYPRPCRWLLLNTWLLTIGCSACLCLCRTSHPQASCCPPRFNTPNHLPDN
jgi:hypothetical protein